MIDRKDLLGVEDYSETRSLCETSSENTVGDRTWKQRN